MAQKPASFHIFKLGRREPANRRPSSQQRIVKPKGAVKPISSCTRNSVHPKTWRSWLQVLAIVAGSGENGDSLLAQVRVIAEQLLSQLKTYLAKLTLGCGGSGFVPECVTRPKLID